MRQPFLPYQRNVLDVVEETFPRKEDVMFTERLMEEAELDEGNVNEPMSEKNVSEKGVETNLEEMEGTSDETKENIDEEGLEDEEEKEEEEEEEEAEAEEEAEEEEEEEEDEDEEEKWYRSKHLTIEIQKLLSKSRNDR